MLLCTTGSNGGKCVQLGPDWDVKDISVCLCVHRSSVRNAGRVAEECDAEKQRGDDKLQVGAASLWAGLPAVLRHRPVSR